VQRFAELPEEAALLELPEEAGAGVDQKSSFAVGAVKRCSLLKLL
jgi:hypothetical protein